MEIFPVEIAIKGETIWVGWVSPEDGNEFFLTHDGCLIYSNKSKQELMQEIIKLFPYAQTGTESFFDFDSALGGGDGRVVLEGDLALDVWNLLIDLYHTFDSSGKVLSEYGSEVYHRLFSQSEAASIVDVQRVQLSRRDVEVVREVLLEGIEFFVQKVSTAKMSRSQAR
ncbi:hypothetical protein [Dyella sp. 2RAB6]|uniref:hypothetical protein n=1 Tax=Dyella sp. 2RAB6 TaxID=3232992 RepID=UPI003F93329D